ncbi:hypothetical protein RJ55_02638 [Drechmeria coniospora]|nr:hypothetical protein RJ55_02638 [Drechmeria coniospora]
MPRHGQDILHGGRCFVAQTISRIDGLDSASEQAVERPDIRRPASRLVQPAHEQGLSGRLASHVQARTIHHRRRHGRRARLGRRLARELVGSENGADAMVAVPRPSSHPCPASRSSLVDRLFVPLRPDKGCQRDDDDGGRVAMAMAMVELEASRCSHSDHLQRARHRPWLAGASSRCLAISSLRGLDSAADQAMANTSGLAMVEAEASRRSRSDHLQRALSPFTHDARNATASSMDGGCRPLDVATRGMRRRRPWLAGARPLAAWPFLRHTASIPGADVASRIRQVSSAGAAHTTLPC